ncbi:hypothetical protein MTO96_036274 [Rhipicephalus appendiculatus]
MEDDEPTTFAARCMKLSCEILAKASSRDDTVVSSHTFSLVCPAFTQVSSRVYCAAYCPGQNVVPMDRDGISLCAICSEQMTHRSVDVLVTPCCRQLFHQACIQRQAVSAGSHFFRCCHCNNQEAFQREMQDHGIYVPDQDASWEREPHAFEELLFQVPTL